MVGPTGKFAGLVLPELKRRGVTIYTLVRDEDKPEKAKEAGADEIIIRDLGDKNSLTGPNISNILLLDHALLSVAAPLILLLKRMFQPNQHQRHQQKRYFNQRNFNITNTQ